jgi:hypothetical protein
MKMLTADVAKRSSECVRTNSIFQEHWWLDAVAPGRWGEVTVQRDGRIAAHMPYVVRGRRRMRMLTMPPVTQTLGPWIAPGTASPARALGHEHELLAALEAGLPDAAAFVQQFSPAVMNALAFHWAGYRLDVQYTYRLPLRSEEELWEGLRSNIRREIRKARRRVEVREDLGLDRFHAIWAKTFTRQGLPVPITLAALERLDAACTARGARLMTFARDEADRVHAVSYVVWDRNAAFNLLGGADPELRTSGASSLLMWEAILRARDVTDVFDFEGSMIQPVERFFRAFGSRQTPYLRVSRAKPAAAAALAARDRLRYLTALRRP